MLKHENTPNIQSQPAAQVRVTPEELAAAVTALQIRKEGQPGTIAIGDVVEELGLDVTPEEVLEEVQARRKSKPKDRRDYWALLCAAVCAVPLVAGAVICAVSPGAQATSTGSASISAPSAVPLPIAASPNLMVGDLSGKLMLLSEVGNDYPVRCRWYSGHLYRYSPGDIGEDFTLIKYGGKLYLRGWMQRMSPKVLALRGADISSQQSSSYTVRVTLPMDGVKESVLTSDTQMYGSTIPVEDVHLDKHAYEKW